MKLSGYLPLAQNRSSMTSKFENLLQVSGQETSMSSKYLPSWPPIPDTFLIKISTWNFQGIFLRVNKTRGLQLRLGISWDHWVIWDTLGVIWDHLGIIWDHLGIIWDHLGDTWCHLVVILVDSDRQSKFLSEWVSRSVSQSGRLPDLELLLCETESELKNIISFNIK